MQLSNWHESLNMQNEQPVDSFWVYMFFLYNGVLGECRNAYDEVLDAGYELYKSNVDEYFIGLAMKKLLSSVYLNCEYRSKSGE